MNAFWRTSVTADDIDATLLAAILHDVGHIAFGHFLEEMGDIFWGLKHTDFTIAVLDCALKELGKKITDVSRSNLFTISAPVIQELIKVIQQHWVRSTELLTGETVGTRTAALLLQVRSIFSPATTQEDLPVYLSKRGTRSAVNLTMRSIIDGPLDADKLDYLRRDAWHAGVWFSSGIDLERFFESLRVCVSTTEKSQEFPPPAIGVSEKGVTPIESIITARYHLFGVVYWHRITRSVTAMLQRVIAEVLLNSADDKWNEFLGSLLENFRELDDDQALDWLSNTLSAANERSRGSLGLRKIGSSPEGVTILTLLDALRGDRSKYFKVAFELNYIDPSYPSNRSGQFGRERLHGEISKKVYEAKPDENGEVTLVAAREHQRAISSFRKELEQRFQTAVIDLGYPSFRIDTILLDVPEPGKDQISSIRVDTRTKRSQARDHFVQRLQEQFPRIVIATKAEFVELTRISPIAGSLDRALDLWARKVRIFMAPADLKQLAKFKFTAGDIALLWEKILYNHFAIYDDNQSEMLLG
jgi:HD superfamily phosphohydrolase